ncbi:hypothetical protein [Thermoplasma volcanium GSS1]|uniref:Uncharacterized protein n=1 Tax=Thermoplasma volcanium (strain ATCC 51530 / DSM 4299 / JCM 9571 / NBRC 15438 / GSS1) TaxID=273116 RepID=Q97BJ7_THEVO|nr:hypothetical protein [Thermoplasma volcanium]BAB59600.1 hypothetical protein [Thermoplasma volcanium GSS1]
MKNRLISFILMVIIISTTVILINGSASAQPYSSSYLNFQKYASGSFPSNTSNYSFSIINKTKDTNIGIKSINGVKGLNIYSINESDNAYENLFSQGTFLKISFNNAENKTIALNFTYAYWDIGGLDENDFYIFSGGREIESFNFTYYSPFDQYYPAFHETSMRLKQNVTYTLSLSVYRNFTLLSLASLNQNLTYPIYFQSGLVNGPLSLLIGSVGINLTLYSIKELPEIPVASPKLISYSQEKTDFLVSSKSPLYLDEKLNSIIVMNSTGVYSLNYEDNRSSMLYSMNSTFQQYCVSSGILYILLSGDTSSIVALNTINLHVRKYVQIDEHLDDYWISAGNKLIVYNKTTLQVINSTGTVYIITGYGKIIYINPNSTLVEYYNSTENKIYVYNYSSKSYDIYNIGLSASNITFLFDGSSSLVENGAGSPFSFYDGALYPEELTAGDNYFRYGDTVLLNSGYIYDNSLPAHLFFVNENYLVGEQNGYIVIMYNSSNILSNFTIRANYTGYSYLRGIENLNFVVNSTLQYTSQLRIGNYSDEKENNSEFTVNTLEIGNGSKTMKFCAENIAGYSINISDQIFVDNYFPTIRPSIENGSYVSDYSAVNFSIFGDPIISNVSLFINNETHTYIGNFTYILTKNGTNSFKIKITDIYGFSFNFTYTYFVYSIPKLGINIYDGEYFNTSKVTLRMNPYNLSYSILIKGSNSSFYTVSKEGVQNLSLRNGIYLVDVSTTYFGRNINVFNGSITILTYAPKLNVEFNGNRYYSIYGNSKNDTVQVGFSTNITAYISVILSYGKDKFPIGHFLDNGRVTLNSTDNLLIKNGYYNLTIQAISNSGTSSNSTILFYVNNSIPTRQVFRVYSNKTYVKLPYGLLGEEKIYPEINDSLMFPALGHYVLNFTYVTKTSNWINNTLYANLSNYAPAIYLKISNRDLNGSYYLHILAYPKNLTSLVITINGLRLRCEADFINYLVVNDSLLKISAIGTDIYGNSNKSQIYNYSAFYYPYVNGYRLTMHFGVSETQFSLYLLGYKLSGVHIYWLFDGKNYSGGTNMEFRNGIGSYRLTVLVTFHNGILKITRSYFSIGYLFISPVLAIGLIPIYLATRNSDVERLKDMLISVEDKRLDALIKEMKRLRYTKRTINKTIKELNSIGKLEIGKDMDGKQVVSGLHGKTDK